MKKAWKRCVELLIFMDVDREAVILEDIEAKVMKGYMAVYDFVSEKR